MQGHAPGSKGRGACGGQERREETLSGRGSLVLQAQGSLVNRLVHEDFSAQSGEHEGNQPIPVCENFLNLRTESPTS